MVVLGSRASEIRPRVAFGRAETVVCEEWESGQAWSLRRGVAALRDGGGVSSVVVTLGDAPLVTPEVIRLFVDAPPRSRAVYGGRPGHPVVLGLEEISALGSLAGDEGARGLLHGGPEVEVGHLCSGRDVDTPEDLEEVRDEARAVL
jgi:CTP:molybdopterin cytidylyltransferase MocA